MLKTPDVDQDPMGTRAHVASDSSLMVLLSSVHQLHLKLIDVKTTILNSPLAHEVWVRFLAEYKHPSGDAFANLHKFLYGPNHAASDWRGSLLSWLLIMVLQSANLF